MSIIDNITGTTVELFNGKTFDLLEIFNIDVEDLSESFTKQSAIYAYFAQLLAIAENKLAKAEFVLDQENAAADEYYRNTLDKEEKKYTEAVIKSLVQRDEQYIKYKEVAIQAEYDVKLLKAVTRAMEQRSDMLISLGALTRQELSMTGMSMREKEYDGLPNDLKAIIAAAKKRK